MLLLLVPSGPAVDPAPPIGGSWAARRRAAIAEQQAAQDVADARLARIRADDDLMVLL